jgi:hypothetical protein
MKIIYLLGILILRRLDTLVLCFGRFFVPNARMPKETILTLQNLPKMRHLVQS